MHESVEFASQKPLQLQKLMRWPRRHQHEFDVELKQGMIGT
jgi:hypothetical protein